MSCFPTFFHHLPRLQRTKSLLKNSSQACSQEDSQSLEVATSILILSRSLQPASRSMSHLDAPNLSSTEYQDHESPTFPSSSVSWSTEDRMDYEYQPLVSNDEIRRLILEPGAGDASLIGSMERIRLSETSDSTSFEAISYVWGSDIKDHWIKIDGKAIPITTSLSDALRQVRRPDRPRALWADAICINQDNYEEKNHQVALMGRIYRASSCTLICLLPPFLWCDSSCSAHLSGYGQLQQCAHTQVPRCTCQAGSLEDRVFLLASGCPTRPLPRCIIQNYLDPRFVTSSRAVST